MNREVIKSQFKNITELLDCIGCNICKVNGKVQFTGLAAMFKVVFPEDEKIMVTENELAGLFNLIHRLSNSIKWYKEWRQYEKRQAFYKTVMFAVLLAFAVSK